MKNPFPHFSEQFDSLRRGRLTEHRDPLHEEFVEVRRNNRQELRPLEQRRPLVERLREYAIAPGAAILYSTLSNRISMYVKEELK